jgi:hypothetical protein
VYAATYRYIDVHLPGVIQPLVEVLFLVAQTFNFLLYSEPDGIDCSLLVLWFLSINPLNAELNPICPLLTLFGAHHILHVSRKRVNLDVDVIRF